VPLSHLYGCTKDGKRGYQTKRQTILFFPWGKDRKSQAKIAYLRDMKRIGLTGGIGSGKSFVAEVLSKMGYPVYYSDDRAKVLTAENLAIREGLISRFGVSIFDQKGLNKKALAAEIFHSEESRLYVNELIHPVVRADFQEWSTQQSAALVFNESALHFETGAFRRLDYTLLITAPMDLRVHRVIAREGCTKAEVLARMQSQWGDNRKKGNADYVIINDEKRPLLHQIENAIEMFLLSKN
jgi:dephospho-CoA kinase